MAEHVEHTEHGRGQQSS